MCPFCLGEADKRHHTGERHQVSGLIWQQASPIWVCSTSQGEMLPGMFSSCRQQGDQVCIYQKASFSKIIPFSSPKKVWFSHLHPVAHHVLAKPLEAEQDPEVTQHDDAPKMPQTAVTPLPHTDHPSFSRDGLKLGSSTDRSLAISDPEALATLHLKSMSFLILTDVRKIYPERSYFTACVFWCVCSFSTPGSQATAPSPNPLSPRLEGYKL